MSTAHASHQQLTDYLQPSPMAPRPSASRFHGRPPADSSPDLNRAAFAYFDSRTLVSGHDARMALLARSSKAQEEAAGAQAQLQRLTATSKSWGDNGQVPDSHSTGTGLNHVVQETAVPSQGIHQMHTAGGHDEESDLLPRRQPPYQPTLQPSLQGGNLEQIPGLYNDEPLLSARSQPAHPADDRLPVNTHPGRLTDQPYARQASVPGLLSDETSAGRHPLRAASSWQHRSTSSQPEKAVNHLPVSFCLAL